MADTSFIPPPPPPLMSPTCPRPSLGRQSSWHRTSSLPGSVPPPPPPPPPPESWVTEDDYIEADELRGNEPGFVLDGKIPSSYAHVTPDMFDEIRIFRQFLDAGGFEGLKKQIVEEVGERLRSDTERSSFSSSARSSSPNSPTSYSSSPTTYSHSFSSPPKHSPNPRESFLPKPPNFATAPPTGPAFPQTPPDSPLQKPQSDVGLSIVDKRWGQLFDENGKATRRLGQVLRGVANYLISQVAPLEPLVIPPSKLSVFYRQYAVENEPHCFADVFKCREDDREDWVDIQFLFEDLECNYHLIKHSPKSPNIVPALTPDGFVKWTIMAIYANPDVEAKRLDRIMSKLPIDSDGPLVDGKPERLPKQLSRHLLPPRADKTAQKNLDSSIKEVLSERKKRDRKNAEKARRSSTDNSGLSGTPPKNRDRDSSHHDSSSDSSSKRKEEKKAPAKIVRFSNKDRDCEGPSSSQSTRPSKEGAGRPYNLSNITLPPTARGQERSPSTKSPRHVSADSSSAEPHSTPPPPPSVSPLDLHSGRDRLEKDEKYYRYSSKAEDVTPRRMPNGSGDDVPRTRRRRSVVVTQDKVPSRHHSRRESAADYAGHQHK